MQVHLAGLRTGPYRIVIHANGNCTSPNAFSAGPPWIPAGASPQTIAQMQAAVMVGDNAFSLVQRISGRADGWRGSADRQIGGRARWLARLAGRRSPAFRTIASPAA
jgi:hypothetical protein